MNYCWLLNPDAEMELAHHAAGNGGPYASTARTREAMEARRSVFSDLTREDTAVLSSELESVSLAGRPRFLPWCPTPSLVLACGRARIDLPRIPETEALILANDKTELDRWHLPLAEGRRTCRHEAELEPLCEYFDVLRLKRRFGFAGRGQRRVTKTWSPDDQRWIRDSLMVGPLVAEPEVEAPELISIHLMIHASDVLVGTPLAFECDDFGAFKSWKPSSSRRAPRGWVRDLARSAGERLLEAGYFGPASIDFVESRRGDVFAIDLNARFSLGWSLGMGDFRGRALDLYTQTSG